MKKKIFALGLAVLMAFAAVGCSGGKTEEASADAGTTTTTEEGAEGAEAGEAEYLIKLGNVVAPEHPYALGAAKMAELLAEKTDGRAKIDVFNNGQLGAERDLVEGLQLGTLEVAICSAAPLASFTDDLLVFDLPFLFPDAETARAVADSDLCQGFLDGLDEQGLKGLCYFENGFRSITNSRQPIVTPDDWKGLKIRTMENQMHIAIWSALGADPTPMAWTEVFTALQQGAIDAQENPLAMVETSKLYEVQKYLSLSNHVYNPAPVLMSLDYYNNLPEDIQQAVVEAANESKDYQRSINDEQEAEILASLPDKGMEINEVDMAAFQEKLQPVYDEFIGTGEGQVDPEIYEQVLELIEQK